MKDPEAGSGQERARAVEGLVVSHGMPGDEPSRINFSTNMHNGACQAVYKPWFGGYPVVLTPV